MEFNKKLRNIAIIAHVDHGKTTMVDHMLRQGGVFREGAAVSDRVMDSGDLERERGITISAKNCAVYWKDVKINILDTPGHADFGGEVERALSMVDGAILLVDAAEGALPQTRFVLKKALESNLSIMVIINKIDRKDARPREVHDQVLDLLIDLEATEAQLDCPFIYAIGREGISQPSLDEPGKDLSYLFDTILAHVPPPAYDPAEPFQMMVSNLAYSDYVGRLVVGKVLHGAVKKNDPLIRINRNDELQTLRVSKIQVYDGVKFREVDDVEAGDVAILAGIEEVEIGDTICHRDNPKKVKRLEIEEPTISMLFTINTSPYAGREGKIVQSKRIAERLYKEALSNVALKIEASAGEETFIVKGRGEFQMAILIEQMRREGFELTVGRPQIIFKHVDGKKLEPIEHLIVDCDETHIGQVTEKLAKRRGKMTNMVNHGTGRVRLEFTVPSRGLIGYRNEFLTDTKGTGLLNSSLSGYEEYRGDIVSRENGSLVSDRLGDAVPYALWYLEERGILFIPGGVPVYEGMIIGEHNRENDLNVNPCKSKKLTNIRAAGKDENVTLTPHTNLTLEKAIEFIRDDEMIEVTPVSIRLRKVILDANKRPH
jgi:GTP-binding protein